MKLHHILTEAPTNAFLELCFDFSVFTSLNFVKLTSYAVDNAAQQELSSMVKRLQQPAINGLTFAQVIGDKRYTNDPRLRAVLLKWIYDNLLYIEPRLNRYVNQQGKQLLLPRLNAIKQRYVDLVAKQA